MQNYFTEERIINQVCIERLKLAERRDQMQYLPKLIGGRDPIGKRDALDDILPPRQHWHRFRPRRRTEDSKTSLRSLRIAVKKLRAENPAVPWVRNLNKFILETQQRVLGQTEFQFAKPKIAWLPKPGKDHKYRALCLFSLQDSVISKLFASYIRDQFDVGFSPCSFAFRARNAEGHAPTHHDAFNRLYVLKGSQPEKELFVAECDIQGFFDTVDHVIALKQFSEFARRFKIPPRACEIFRAYLSCYNFPFNVLLETQPRLQKADPRGYFPWPGEAVVQQSGRVLGVPQGGAISGIIANLVLDAADKAVEKEAARLGAEVHYYRFCDDMLLVSPVKKHCELVYAAYLKALEEMKLPYHKPEQTIIYGAKHWSRKSKAVYRWTGRNWFGCVPWVQFVGYQVRYDGLCRARKGAFTTQADKFVTATNEIKFGLVKAGARRPLVASRLQAWRSFAFKLTAKGVGRLFLYAPTPRPMSWSNGFKALDQKPIVTGQLRKLDALRQKQIIRFADTKINYAPEKPGVKITEWNPIGYLQSYFRQFKNSGGNELIQNPWQAKTRLEWLQRKIFRLSRSVQTGLKTLLALWRTLKQRFAHTPNSASQFKIEAGETWVDTKYRRDHVYEVLEVGTTVKCRYLGTNRIRYLSKHSFVNGRYRKLSDKNNQCVAHTNKPTSCV